MNPVERWERRIKILKIAASAIIITAILSLSIIAVTVYAENVGNFIITVAKKDERSLLLSESKDFTIEQKSLTAPAVDGMYNTTYSYLPKPLWELEGGSANGNRFNDKEREQEFLAYCFYLKNVNESAIDYSVSIDITGGTAGMADAVRVMVIRDGVEKVYAKSSSVNDDSYEPTDKFGMNPNYADAYAMTPFVAPKKVCYENYTGFAANGIHKYIVVMWLEGWDESCTDAIMGGALRMNMMFTITN